MNAVSGRMLAFSKLIIAKSDSGNVEMRPCGMLFGEIFEEFRGSNGTCNRFSAPVPDVGDIAFNVRNCKRPKAAKATTARQWRLPIPVIFAK